MFLINLLPVKLCSLLDSYINLVIYEVVPILKCESKNSHI